MPGEIDMSLRKIQCHRQNPDELLLDTSRRLRASDTA